MEEKQPKTDEGTFSEAVEPERGSLGEKAEQMESQKTLGAKEAVREIETYFQRLRKEYNELGQKMISRMREDDKKRTLKRIEEIKKQLGLPGQELSKVCEKCGSIMIQGQGEEKEFWICGNAPQCSNKKSIQS